MGGNKFPHFQYPAMPKTQVLFASGPLDEVK